QQPESPAIRAPSITSPFRHPIGRCSRGILQSAPPMTASGSKVPKRNAFYAQSGGVTAVVNTTACAVIETARKHPARIGRLYAGRNGIIGALTEDLIDTGKESARAIAALRQTPAGASGSSPYQPATPAKDRAHYERRSEAFRPP